MEAEQSDDRESDVTNTPGEEESSDSHHPRSPDDKYSPVHSSRNSRNNEESPSKDSPRRSHEQPEEGQEGDGRRSAEPGSPDASCSICLGQVENKSFTDSCFHTFCFVCLMEWSKVKAVCPLCKQPFKSIIHNVRSYEDYDQYDLAANQRASDNDYNDARFRYRTTLTSERWLARQQREEERQLEMLRRPTRSNAHSLWRPHRQAATSAFRKRIYSTGMRVTEVRTACGRPMRYREISPAFFTRNPACSHRLVPWLNREINVLLHNHEDNVQFLLELIVDLIKRFDIHSEEFAEHIRSYLGRNTSHFIHEFYMFARSPYDLMAYDQHAVYDVTNNNSELHEISSDSDSDNSVVALDLSMDTEAPGPSSTLTHRDSGRSNNVIVLDSDEDSDDDIIISGESYRRPRKEENSEVDFYGSISPVPPPFPGLNPYNSFCHETYHNFPNHHHYMNRQNRSRHHSHHRHALPYPDLTGWRSHHGRSGHFLTPSPLLNRVHNFLSYAIGSSDTSHTGWDDPPLDLSGNMHSFPSSSAVVYMASQDDNNQPSTSSKSGKSSSKSGKSSSKSGKSSSKSKKKKSRRTTIDLSVEPSSSYGSSNDLVASRSDSRSSISPETRACNISITSDDNDDANICILQTDGPNDNRDSDTSQATTSADNTQNSQPADPESSNAAENGADNADNAENADDVEENANENSSGEEGQGEGGSVRVKHESFSSWENGSDIVIVGYEKPWEERSPVPLSSAAEEELRLAEVARKKKAADAIAAERAAAAAAAKSKRRSRSSSNSSRSSSSSSSSSSRRRKRRRRRNRSRSKSKSRHRRRSRTVTPGRRRRSGSPSAFSDHRRKRRHEGSRSRSPDRNHRSRSSRDRYDRSKSSASRSRRHRDRSKSRSRSKRKDRSRDRRSPTSLRRSRSSRSPPVYSRSKPRRSKSPTHSKNRRRIEKRARSSSSSIQEYTALGKYFMPEEKTNAHQDHDRRKKKRGGSPSYISEWLESRELLEKRARKEKEQRRKDRETTSKKSSKKVLSSYVDQWEDEDIRYKEKQRQKRKEKEKEGKRKEEPVSYIEDWVDESTSTKRKTTGTKQRVRQDSVESIYSRNSDIRESSSNRKPSKTSRRTSIEADIRESSSNKKSSKTSRRTSIEADIRESSSNKKSSKTSRRTSIEADIRESSSNKKSSKTSRRTSIEVVYESSRKHKTIDSYDDNTVKTSKTASKKHKQKRSKELDSDDMYGDMDDIYGEGISSDSDKRPSSKNKKSTKDSDYYSSKSSSKKNGDRLRETGSCKLSNGTDKSYKKHPSGHKSSKSSSSK